MSTPLNTKQILEAFKAEEINADEAREALLQAALVEEADAVIDLQRENRCGLSEVVFGLNKNESQLITILSSLLEHQGHALATRVSADKATTVTASLPELKYCSLSETLYSFEGIAPRPGKVAIFTAGTSDLPAAEEAAQTIRYYGAEAEIVVDVGVAGLHRLLRRVPDLRQADIVIVAAGMEAALPSVIGGLVEVPVIALPVSTGYGSSFGGVTALLGMLNSCASGLSVVNIDNGFGAGYAAIRILRTGERL